MLNYGKKEEQRKRKFCLAIDRERVKENKLNLATYRTKKGLLPIKAVKKEAMNIEYQ